jgi:hypothetical protein
MQVEKANLTIKSMNLLMHNLAGGIKGNSLLLLYDTKLDKYFIKVHTLVNTKGSPSHELLTDNYQCMTALLDMKRAVKADIQALDSALLRLLNLRDTGFFTDVPTSRVSYNKKTSNVHIKVTELFVYRGEQLHV